MADIPKMVTTWTVGATKHGVTANGEEYYRSGDRWYRGSLGGEESVHMAALASAVKALGEALTCAECNGSNCHIIGDSDDTLAQEPCPLRTAALALPVVREIMGGER